MSLENRDPDQEAVGSAQKLEAILAMLGVEHDIRDIRNRYAARCRLDELLRLKEYPGGERFRFQHSFLSAPWKQTDGGETPSPSHVVLDAGVEIERDLDCSALESLWVKGDLWLRNATFRLPKQLIVDKDLSLSGAYLAQSPTTLHVGGEIHIGEQTSGFSLPEDCTVGGVIRMSAPEWIRGRDSQGYDKLQKECEKRGIEFYPFWKYKTQPPSAVETFRRWG